MQVTIWEFRARTGREDEFERAYGPRGEWAGLFQRGEGFLGTELLREVGSAGRYVTLDRWVSRGAFESFQRRYGDDYKALDARLEALTEHEAHLGWFEVSQ